MSDVITIVEDPESRSTEIGSPESLHRRVYTIRGTAEHGLAVCELMAFAPMMADPYEGGPLSGLVYLARRNVRVDPKAASQTWSGTVSYSSFAPDEFAFDIGGGTEHVVVNDQGPTFSYAPAGKTAPNFHGLIGVNGNQIEGCDIPPGNLSVQFCRKRTLLTSQVTLEYIATLVGIRNAVNNAPFYGLASGEALFMGATGRPLGDGTWEVLVRWAGSPNRTDFAIPPPPADPIISGISKEGWDYLWVLSEEDEDQDSLVRIPIAAYVERLLPRRDFSLIGIGTEP